MLNFASEVASSRDMVEEKIDNTANSTQFPAVGGVGMRVASPLSHCADRREERPCGAALRALTQRLVLGSWRKSSRNHVLYARRRHSSLICSLVSRAMVDSVACKASKVTARNPDLKLNDPRLSQSRLIDQGFSTHQ
ncbi:hypothetical protein PGTUg99_019985 [Puccinia graminis f. sp. tritici]|uniref:Uncharacterized protein n=1 Tax=Puccinia graminis f. sp. tritici TaxID=56615 RepID=A0A5B0NJ51_PUCGR|nr:hypothetical protein PGTUg99_019985 [Puccinia graminis f. sp. tritici]